MSTNDTRNGYIIIGEPKLTDEEIKKLKQKLIESYKGVVDFVNIAVIEENEDEEAEGTIPTHHFGSYPEECDHRGFRGQCINPKHWI